MKQRTMDWKPIYGLDHPTWERPTNFFHPTAERAREAIVRAYGEDSGHIVVRMERVPATTEEDAA